MLPKFRLAHNKSTDRSLAYGPSESAILNHAGLVKALAQIQLLPGYQQSPLRPLPGLAQELRVARLYYKDESGRFGLKSFKALGGGYAVLEAALAHLKTTHGIGGARVEELVDGSYRTELGDLTVAAATDGNHGRAVAWAARLFGCRCVIYLHAHVSHAREQEISRHGAVIRRVSGDYDDSVRACIEEAKARAWIVIQDTALAGSDDVVPYQIMQGYQVLIDEVMMQLPEGERLGHVFVPAGVGGLAAAVAGYFWERQGSNRPRIVVVEPIAADCVYRSIEADQPTNAEGDLNTFMACLAAGEVSHAAWPILRHCVDHVLALDDQWAKDAMRRLAIGTQGDPPIVAGESGAAALAGMMAIANDDEARAQIDLDPTSSVLIIGSEGATDEETYQRIVGRPSTDIEKANRELS